ncbi:hypothetical protein [Desulfurobacterium crinifex]
MDLVVSVLEKLFRIKIFFLIDYTNYYNHPEGVGRGKRLQNKIRAKTDWES